MSTISRLKQKLELLAAGRRKQEKEELAIWKMVALLVKRGRILASLKAKDLAERVGISAPAITYLEQGKGERNISLDTLARIIQVLEEASPDDED